MTDFYDFLISGSLKEKASELNWNPEKVSVKVLEADDRGELKKKIQRSREDYDILGFRGGDHELNRKAFSDERMDVVLHPGKGRKDSGMNHVDARKASQNHVAVGFSLKQLPEDPKRQSQELTKWRRNLKLSERYGTPYLLTTEADMFSDLRKPRDLAAVINSLGYNGVKAVSKVPKKILEENRKAQSSSRIRPGHEVVE